MRMVIKTKKKISRNMKKSLKRVRNMNGGWFIPKGSYSPVQSVKSVKLVKSVKSVKPDNSKPFNSKFNIHETNSGYVYTLKTDVSNPKIKPHKPNNKWGVPKVIRKFLEYINKKKLNKYEEFEMKTPNETGKSDFPKYTNTLNNTFEKEIIFLLKNPHTPLNYKKKMLEFLINKSENSENSEKSEKSEKSITKDSLRYILFELKNYHNLNKINNTKMSFNENENKNKILLEGINKNKQDTLELITKTLNKLNKKHMNAMSNT